MNKATVPIVTRLAALQAKAVVSAGGARVIAALGDPSPMTALLREVNETILGRSLRFESSGGSSLTVEVAGRRVLRLTEANGLENADACLAAEALEDEHKDELIRLMQAVAAPRQELRVTSFASSQSNDGLSVGLPVALLADLLLIDLNDTPKEERPEPAPRVARPRVVPLTDRPISRPAPGSIGQPEAVQATAGRSLEKLARAMGPALTAWLIRGGEADGASEGPEEMVSHLKGFLEDEAEAVLRQLDLVSNQPGGDVCGVFGATLIEGHSVLCARSGAGLLLGVIEGDATTALLSAWAAFTA